MNNCIVIAAGGTGGHLYPGIAFAEKLRLTGKKVFFVVRKNDTGKTILDGKNFEFFEIDIAGLPRKIDLLKSILFLYKLIKSFFQTSIILSQIEPDIVIGMGGHVSFSVVVLAKLKQIKSIIHEQNYLPGIANYSLSRIADKVAISFPETKKYFQEEKVIFTGSPVRKEFFKVLRDAAIRKFGLTKDRFTLLIFGGSQGAHNVNKLVLDGLELMDRKIKDRIQIVHLTGEKDYGWVKESYRKHNVQSAVFGYLDSIGEGYSVSDLVISRAGASTIAELIALKKPAILIPYPYATDNHQLYNAKYLEKYKVGLVYEEKTLTSEIIYTNIFYFINFPQKLNEMKNNYVNIPAGNPDLLIKLIP
ncbi:MAG: undecaprenyldiphospho-muramoylpentapeptide beta-N-acetylglucosaminyltransferase [Elusimicrobia bacterium CG1_02_37_114]|nr:MAG: undecaprenyldiphospho-muramoylpentapeptide beta-N-acetylglucosaminyltransferase [Elusimicrobia bacterium CG1_02_37_114]PIV52413.1 MAG: undecaprenyldiphospho-muramoylpentapeptide beta-N-acetylglucosaminyltransferase [Elusimicrobia bacterium CG02_land_8_20_14_3_00_37_13]PIZ13133.1 MAG: undecaprenyldiphospho-muramoylpentapeptide beta-N-acetylglucosaminyltransferase [Elusimicrobia bacterium CG_4_10_14_0_8_um_filter_37_32]